MTTPEECKAKIEALETALRLADRARSPDQWRGLVEDEIADLRIRERLEKRKVHQ